MGMSKLLLNLDINKARYKLLLKKSIQESFCWKSVPIGAFKKIKNKNKKLVS